MDRTLKNLIPAGIQTMRATIYNKLEDFMENEVIQLEYQMWETALHKDVIGFKKLVLPDAVMICGGYRCLGNEYAEFIADFNISGYSISNMEVIHISDSEVTLHYVLRTQAEDIEAQDLTGLFHVVSIWRKKSNTWHLIFNMDSRIAES